MNTSQNRVDRKRSLPRSGPSHLVRKHFTGVTFDGNPHLSLCSKTYFKGDARQEHYFLSYFFSGNVGGNSNHMNDEGVN